MNLQTHVLLTSSLCALLAASTLYAADDATVQTEEKRVIALQTDDFALAETDISHLAVGDAESIVTESGKVIDLLHTESGVEIYVDGELMEMGAGAHADADADHAMAHDIEMICEVDGEESTECGHDVMVFAGEDVDIDALHADGEAHGMIIKKVHKVCSSEDESSCEESVWVSKGDDADFGSLHGAHDGDVLIEKSDDGQVVKVRKIIKK